jgi:hypothetical protein
MSADERARCLCCGFLTLEHPDAQALCPVCWWQDDGQDDDDADVVRGTVNGGLSLSMARVNFRKLGAAHESYLAHVRQPLASEQAIA